MRRCANKIVHRPVIILRYAARKWMEYQGCAIPEEQIRCFPQDSSSFFFSTAPPLVTSLQEDHRLYREQLSV